MLPKTKILLRMDSTLIWKERLVYSYQH
jgi:hypothetical protein